MKIITKIVLNIIFIIAFVIFSISMTLRFQILNANFWEKTFNDNGIYSNLSVALKNNLENQITTGGGIKSDSAALTDLVTPENLRDFIDNNIANLLNFANGKNKNVLIYLPVDKIPSGILPLTENKISKETKLQDLLNEFNIEGVSVVQIERFSVFGIISNTLMVISAIVMVLTLSALNFSSLTLLLGGVFVTVFALLLFFLRSAIVYGLATGQNLVVTVLKIITPPILQKIYSLWLYESLTVVVISFVLFLVKRSYNIKSK